MMKKVFFAVFTAIAIAALSLFVACGDKQGGGGVLCKISVIAYLLSRLPSLRIV